MSEEKRLDMYGGILGGAVPLAVLIIGLVWLCLAERGGTKPFWACAWLALVIGLFFARKKEDYCLAAMRGIGDENGIVIVTAWLFAGVFGKLMAAFLWASSFLPPCFSLWVPAHPPAPASL